MANLGKLPAFEGGNVHVIVEASRGMAAKCNYDSKRGLFVMGKPLQLLSFVAHLRTET